MERISLHHLEKYCSSQGGPQHGCNWSDSALYSFSQNWTLYSFSRTCSQLWNLSLHSLFASGSFYIGKGKEVTGTEGVESVREFFLPCMLPCKGHCLRTYFVLLSVGIVARSDFRIIFLWLILFLLYQKVKVKTSPLSGIWLPSMTLFFFMMRQSLLSGCFCCNPFHLVWGTSAIKHCPVITVYIFTFLA